MIEYFDERPDMHHEIGALDYMRFTGAPYLASIHSKLKSHKDDDRCHITDEERDKWNRKVDKSTFYELENKVLTKADKKEIPVRLSQLQNDTAFITAADINSRLIGEGYVTEDDLSDYAKKNELNGYISTWVNGQSYVTRTELNGTLNGYVPQRQFTEYIRNNMTPSGGGSIDIDLSEYVKKSELSRMVASDTDFGFIKAHRTNNNLTAAYWKVELTKDGEAYVEPKISGDGGSDIDRTIVEAWVNAALNREVNSIVNQAITDFKNDELEEEVLKVAGSVVQTGLHTYDINVGSLHLAEGVASLLVNKGIVDDTDPDHPGLLSAGIIAEINENGDSSVAIAADKIALTGDTIAQKIEATDMHLSGHIIAENLEIVKDSSNVFTFDNNLYEKGDGVFSGNVIAQGYKTIVNNDGTADSYVGATQTVDISGTKLMFVNGLFVGSYTTSDPPQGAFVEDNPIKVASTTASDPFKPIIKCVYNGQGTESEVAPISFVGELGWTSGIDFNANSLEEIHVTISNPANTIGHPIHTSIWTYISQPVVTESNGDISCGYPSANGSPVRQTVNVTIPVGETRTFKFNMRNASSSLWQEAHELYTRLISEGKTAAQADRQATEKLIAFLPEPYGQVTQYTPALWWDNREQ